jgi:hypothetical protein
VHHDAFRRAIGGTLHRYVITVSFTTPTIFTTIEDTAEDRINELAMVSANLRRYPKLFKLTGEGVGHDLLDNLGHAAAVGSASTVM